MNTFTFRPHTRRFIWLVLDELLEEARALLKARPYIVTDRNISGETALHWLAVEDFREGVELLLEHGADPCCAMLSRESVLSDLVRLGNREMLEVLLRAGADLEQTVGFAYETALHIAASSEYPELVDVLVDAGASLDARDHLGGTPLHVAARFGKRAAAERLLARGADPAAVGSEGETFLDEVDESQRPVWEGLVK